MAAIMTRRKDDIKEITKLMDECRALGIKTLGPDVNESHEKFGTNQKGEIRFGLAGIKGMGEAAAVSIIEEREKNGPYKSIFDFAQRVNFSQVNRKAFESLVLSGGFDSFGIRREQYFGYNNKGDVFLDAVVRYGQLYQQEQQSAMNSLFGGMDAVEIATPQVPEGEEWSTIEKLNKERELVGIYISAHPLDDYSVVLNGMCNTHCNELDDKAELAKKEDISVGGIVTAVKERFGKSGKKFGIVTLEDFETSGELAIFGEEWGRWQGMLTEGCTVFIKAKCTDPYNRGTYRLQISDIQYLQTVKEERIEKLTINLKADKVDAATVSDLTSMVSDNPGTTQLFFQIVNAENNRPVTLRSRLKGINVNRELIQYIETNEDMEYHIN